MKTLADLRAIKEKAKSQMAARESDAKYRIIVSMGTCGIAAGSRDTMSAILDEIEKRGIKDAVVTQTGCLGYCDNEPMLQIAQADKPTVTYGKVNAEIARKIIAEHIVNNTVVSEYVFNLN